MALQRKTFLPTTVFYQWFNVCLLLVSLRLSYSDGVNSTKAPVIGVTEHVRKNGQDHSVTLNGNTAPFKVTTITSAKSNKTETRAVSSQKDDNSETVSVKNKVTIWPKNATSDVKKAGKYGKPDTSSSYVKTTVQKENSSAFVTTKQVQTISGKNDNDKKEEKDKIREKTTNDQKNIEGKSGKNDDKDDEESNEGDTDAGQGTLGDQADADDTNDKNVNRSSFSESLNIPTVEDFHFFYYLLFVIIGGAIIYVGVHNKKKILGLLLEGRKPTGTRRSGVRYRQLSQRDDSDSFSYRDTESNIVY